MYNRHRIPRTRWQKVRNSINNASVVLLAIGMEVGLWAIIVVYFIVKVARMAWGRLTG